MLKKSIVLATAFISTLGAGAAFAAPPKPVVAAPSYHGPREHTSWQSLGEIRVGGRRSHVLDVARYTGPVSRLRLVVRQGDMGLKTVRVTFGNGQSFVTSMSGRFAIVDLPGRARNVQSISVEPAGFARRDRAMVEVSAERGRDFPRHAYR
jgi:hypothetical protein